LKSITTDGTETNGRNTGLKFGGSCVRPARVAGREDEEAGADANRGRRVVCVCGGFFILASGRLRRPPVALYP
jgi:hypothetical protein